MDIVPEEYYDITTTIGEKHKSRRQKNNKITSMFSLFKKVFCHILEGMYYWFGDKMAKEDGHKYDDLAFGVVFFMLFYPVSTVTMVSFQFIGSWTLDELYIVYGCIALLIGVYCYIVENKVRKENFCQAFLDELAEKDRCQMRKHGWKLITVTFPIMIFYTFFIFLVKYLLQIAF